MQMRLANSLKQIINHPRAETLSSRASTSWPGFQQLQTEEQTDTREFVSLPLNIHLLRTCQEKGIVIDFFYFIVRPLHTAISVTCPNSDSEFSVSDMSGMTKGCQEQTGVSGYIADFSLATGLRALTVPEDQLVQHTQWRGVGIRGLLRTHDKLTNVRAAESVSSSPIDYFINNMVKQTE